MKYAAEDTVAGYSSYPQFHKMKLADLSVKAVAKVTKTYRTTCGEVSPDELAISFYALNHCSSIIKEKFTPNEKLEPWAAEVMALYTETVSYQSIRIMHYLISVITREARHLYSPSASLVKDVEAKFSNKMVDFITHISGNSESAAVQKYMDSPPDVTLGQYVGALEYIFFNGKWGGGYGGKPWGNIARCLLQMVEGKISTEMMIDTAYTLAHNNGPMFNKGMMFSHYTNDFKMILDVQRSGQIPELFFDAKKHLMGVSLPNFVGAVLNKVKKQYPKVFGEFVDWHKVQQLGALGSYSGKQAEQDKLHPKAPVEILFNGKPAIKKGEYAVFPGQVVQIYERKAA